MSIQSMQTTQSVSNPVKAMGIFDDVAKLGKPLALFIGGGAILYFSTLMPKEYKQYKPYTMAAGVGVLGWGAFELFKVFKETTPVGKEEAEQIAVTRSIDVAIKDPTPGEAWSVASPHTINVSVTNRGNETVPIWIGLSLRDPNGAIYDLKIKSKEIKANETEKFSWFVGPLAWPGGLPNIRGDWSVISAAWNRVPKPDEPNLVRMGDSGWVPFKYTLLG